MNLVISIFLIFGSVFASAATSIRCKANNVDTYFGMVNIDFVFNFPNGNYSSVLTLSTANKVVKIVKQDSYDRLDMTLGAIFIGTGDAVDATDEATSLPIPGSESIFTVMKGQYSGIFRIKLSLPDKDEAVDFSTRNCIFE